MTDTTPLAQKTGLHRTQSNESLNKNIAAKHPKSQTFSTSNEARSHAAVGQKNNVHFETDFLQQHFPNAIPQKNMMKLRNDETIRFYNSEKRNTERERTRKNYSRTIERAKHKETKGDYKTKMQAQII